MGELGLNGGDEGVAFTGSEDGGGGGALAGDRVVDGRAGRGEGFPCVDEAREVPAEAAAPDVRAGAGGVVGPGGGLGGVVAVG